MDNVLAGSMHLGRTSGMSHRYSVRKAVMGSTRPARRAGR